MTLPLLLAIAATVGLGAWLVMDRDLFRIALGTVLLGHGAVLVLLSPRLPGSAPLIGTDGIVAADVADPLPQAFALTAIVISFAVVTLVLALAHQMFDTPTGGPGSAPEDPAGPEEPS